MRHVLTIAFAAVLAATTAQAQNITLTMAAAAPGSTSDVSAKNLAEVAAAKRIATIQVQAGQTLTRTVQQVAEGETDISTAAFIHNFLLSNALGPYSGVGKEKGKELGGNLRLLYPYHIATYYLLAYQTTGIDSWDDIRGKTIFNGPPRGGALISARHIVETITGMKDGVDYTGKQIAWGQAESIFLDRSVDAAVRPGANPAPWMPVLAAAGKINLVSVPKDVYEGEAWQKLLKAPGRVPHVVPLSEYAHYGDDVKIITEDNMFRSASEAAGEMVHKNMDKKLAKALTAAFIESVPELQKRVPFAKSANYGKIGDDLMGMCGAGVKLHPGALEAWEEAGHEVADCAKP